jgi:hypothetical protein
VLKKSAGRNANTYRIHVLVPGQDFAAVSSPNADPRQKHSPHSPHSPRQNPGDGEVVSGDEPGFVVAPTWRTRRARLATAYWEV